MSSSSAAVAKTTSLLSPSVVPQSTWPATIAAGRTWTNPLTGIPSPPNTTTQRILVPSYSPVGLPAVVTSSTGAASLYHTSLPWTQRAADHTSCLNSALKASVSSNNFVKAVLQNSFTKAVSPPHHSSSSSSRTVDLHLSPHHPLLIQ